MEHLAWPFSINVTADAGAATTTIVTNNMSAIGAPWVNLLRLIGDPLEMLHQCLSTRIGGKVFPRLVSNSHSTSPCT